MKLLPVMLVILLIFLIGLLFLEVRGLNRKSGFFSRLDSPKKNRIISCIAPIALLLLAGVLFKLMGKIAILIALLAGTIFFLTMRKA